MPRHIFPIASGALLLLTVVASGCSSDKSTGPGSGGAPPDALPAQLLGTWHLEQAGEPVCDPGTGECVQSFARSETLDLGDDGSFEHSLFFESHLPPCSLTVHHQSSGRAEASGATLQLHISEGLTHVEDNCGGRGGDTNEAGTTDTFSYQLSESSTGGAQLVLTDEEGTEIGPYERQ
jgi:hypothetical protein